MARSLLLRGNLLVHLDPTTPGVVLPDDLGEQDSLVLQLGLDMTVPIPDLHLDDSGIVATLSFTRTPFTCRIPWEAVHALVGKENRKGLFWPSTRHLDAGRAGVANLATPTILPGPISAERQTASA